MFILLAAFAVVVSGTWTTSTELRVEPLERELGRRDLKVSELTLERDRAVAKSIRLEGEAELQSQVIAELGSENPLVATFGPELLYYQAFTVDTEHGDTISPCLGNKCFEFTTSAVYKKVYGDSPEPKPAIDFWIEFPENREYGRPQVSGVDGVPLTVRSMSGVNRSDYDVRLQVEEVRFGKATIAFAIRRGTLESIPGEWTQEVLFGGGED